MEKSNCQLGCDYVYIAVPLCKSYNILRKAEYELKKEGIGLLIVNEKSSKVNKIINSKKSVKKMGSTSLKVIDKNLHKISRNKHL